MTAYMVNMRRAPTVWNPEPWELVYFPNPNYLNSVWLGIVWNIFLLPHRFLNEVLLTLAHGEIVEAIVLLCMLVGGFIHLIIAGVLGRVHAVRMTIDEFLVSYIMSVEEADADLKSGPGVLRRPLIDQ